MALRGSNVECTHSHVHVTRLACSSLVFFVFFIRLIAKQNQFGRAASLLDACILKAPQSKELKLLKVYMYTCMYVVYRSSVRQP